MFEATVVPNSKDILQILADGWGLNADSIVDADHGTAKCRVIEADGERYFLKEYQLGVAVRQVDMEMCVVNHLRRDRVPVGHIVPILSGDGAVVHRRRVFQLQYFIHGHG